MKNISKKRTARTYSYIRFSTPEQLKGDSLRRQKERSEAYARKHGLILDDSLKLEDLGISAFKGKNSTEGALAGFITAIGKGQVEKGSTLLVESLDRLSREDVVSALTQFLQIINAGVTVVTLMDEMVYNIETIKDRVEILLMSIFSMIRAHDESATKADRISRSWTEKRRKAQEEGKPLTSRCPAWLELKNGKFVIIKERADLIKRIFKLASEGMGKRSIAKIFNSEGIETWGDGKNESRKANGWHDSYIQKILNNESVLGRYQPHYHPKGIQRRSPIGTVIENYFPAVISASLWKSFHNRTAAPRGAKGGKGKLSNLFTRLAYDGYNGAVMRYVDKGGKGHSKYLSSDIKRINPESKGQNWSYHHFESAVLNHLLTFNWESLSKAESNIELSNQLNQEAEINLKIQLLEKQMDSLITEFMDGSTTVKDRVRLKTDEIALDIENNKMLLSRIQSEIEIKNESINAIAEGVEIFKKLAQSNDFKSRIKLQTEISRRIRRINLYRYGNLPQEYSVVLKEGLYDNEKPAIEIIYINGGTSLIWFKKIIPTSITRIRKNSPKRKVRVSDESLWRIYCPTPDDFLVQ
jgi:DNA invertase Pin-like site-specific DNA recombinase